jgi:hypothetical protein
VTDLSCNSLLQWHCNSHCNSHCGSVLQCSMPHEDGICHGMALMLVRSSTSCNRQSTSCLCLFGALMIHQYAVE